MQHILDSIARFFALPTSAERAARKAHDDAVDAYWATTPDGVHPDILDALLDEIAAESTDAERWSDTLDT